MVAIEFKHSRSNSDSCLNRGNGTRLHVLFIDTAVTGH